MAHSTLKHDSLTQRLIKMISTLAPDSPLPPERSLAETLGVSRVTLRNALSELSEDGLIYTIHGAGSYVAHPKVTKRLKLLSFSEEIRDRGLIPSSKILSIELLQPGLQQETIGVVEHPTFKIKRLRFGGNDPLSHETTFISQFIAPELDKHDLTQSIYSILRNNYKIRFDFAEEHLLPITVDAEMANLLNLETGAAAFEISRAAFNSRGQIIEQSKSIRRGDRWAFKYTVKV